MTATDDGLDPFRSKMRESIAAEYRALGLDSPSQSLRCTCTDRRLGERHARRCPYVKARRKAWLIDNPRRFAVRRLPATSWPGLGEYWLDRNPFIIQDRERQGWLGRAPSLDAAFAAIDEILRAEAHPRGVDLPWD